MVKKKYIIITVILIIAVALFVAGIFMVIEGQKNCKEVQCDYFINKTYCAFTYNNISCTCDSTEDPNYSPNYSANKTSDCYINSAHDEPCPSDGRKRCLDVGLYIGGAVCTGFGVAFTLLFLSFYWL